MATDFPTTIDTYVTLLDNITTIMAVYINDVQDAVEALEAKVGINDDATRMHGKVENFFATGRKLYFFENVPPTNWVTEGGLGDTVLAIKGGTQAYDNPGGTKAGVWSMSNWWSSEEHWHTVFYWEANANYSFNVGGGPINTGIGATKAYGLSVLAHHGDPRLAVPNNDEKKAYCSEDYHYHNHYGTWRPRAAVGIVAYYNG